VWEVPTERVVRKGKLGPGEMIAIDLKRGDLLDSDAVDRINRGRAPYKQWLQQGVTYLQTELIDPSLVEEPFDEGTLRSYHKLTSSAARKWSRCCGRWPRPSRKPPARWATTRRWRC
jgi:glutamate synthase (NADPH/NADH) large chain